MIRSSLRRAVRAVVRSVTGGGPEQPKAPMEDAVPVEPPSIEVEADDALRSVRSGALLVDVREPNELYGGHAAGALLVPMRQVDARLAELPRDRAVIVYCAAGARSASVVERLRDAGYADAWSLAGGFGAWAGAGGATVRPPTGAKFGITSAVAVDGRAGSVQAIAETPDGMRYTVQFADGARLVDLPDSRLERLK